ncbi:MAG: hypothetical protein HOE90_17775 [Bacteriovoracaceae bacterium]|jgi:hypothetical protein|nr:hypothetical protein [Bacteriovoracaceae bacterium]
MKIVVWSLAIALSFYSFNLKSEEVDLASMIPKGLIPHPTLCQTPIEEAEIILFGEVHENVSLIEKRNELIGRLANSIKQSTGKRSYWMLEGFEGEVDLKRDVFGMSQNRTELSANLTGLGWDDLSIVEQVTSYQAQAKESLERATRLFTEFEQIAIGQGCSSQAECEVLKEAKMFEIEEEVKKSDSYMAQIKRLDIATLDQRNTTLIENIRRFSSGEGSEGSVLFITAGNSHLLEEPKILVELQKHKYCILTTPEAIKPARDEMIKASLSLFSTNDLYSTLVVRDTSGLEFETSARNFFDGYSATEGSFLVANDFSRLFPEYKDSGSGELSPYQQVYEVIEVKSVGE